MSSWAIVQYDNRPLDDASKALLALNKKYCDTHGYTHIFETKTYDLPPYWIKVKLVQEHLHAYKGIMWLDTDAVVHDQSTPLDAMLNGKTMYYAPDCPRWHSKFNAGVWLIQNTVHGHSIMNSWMNSYSPYDWKMENGKWTTSGPFAGPTYEQGAFEKYIKPRFENHMHVFPWPILQSYEVCPETFTMHFAGDYTDTHLPIYLYGNRWLLFGSVTAVIILLYLTYRMRFSRTGR
jgi:hypothetical protein